MGHYPDTPTPEEDTTPPVVLEQDDALMYALIRSATVIIQSSVESLVESPLASVERADLFLTKLFNRGLSFIKEPATKKEE